MTPLTVRFATLTRHAIGADKAEHLSIVRDADPTTLRALVDPQAMPHLPAWRERILATAKRTGVDVRRVEFSFKPTDRMIASAGTKR